MKQPSRATYVLPKDQTGLNCQTKAQLVFPESKSTRQVCSSSPAKTSQRGKHPVFSQPQYTKQNLSEKTPATCEPQATPKIAPEGLRLVWVTWKMGLSDPLVTLSPGLALFEPLVPGCQPISMGNKVESARLFLLLVDQLSSKRVVSIERFGG